MAKSFSALVFVLPAGLLCLVTLVSAEEPAELPAPDSLDIIVPEMPGQVVGQPPVYDEPQPERPGVSIGGPFGVIINDENGVRIGGPNGVQFGGGAGARFGGPYGVQFGGGEGVRIGPRPYAPQPTWELNNPNAYAPQPTDQSADSTSIHLPRTATEALPIQINGEDTQIAPGETISLDTAQGFVLRIARPNGRYGFRRSWAAGNYEFVRSRRGWMLARAASQPERAAAENTSRAEPSPELEAPAFEPLPAPAGRPE
jgi:hypothetical protein